LSTNNNSEDYINANFIPSHKTYQINYKYIATQAPIPETFADFWRMVFENRSKVIVMLTEAEEEGEDSFLSQIKAHRYWPQVGLEQRYGNIQVETISQQVISDILYQEFILKDLETNNDHKVYFFQYLGWPDMGVPKNTKGIHYIMEKIDEIFEKNNQMGPIIVHCSAGVGRTGTFITIQIILEQLKKRKRLNCQKDQFNFDVYNTVKDLKTCRIGMVQKKEQYTFCYQAILEEAESMNLM